MAEAQRPHLCGFVKVGKLEYCRALYERGAIRLRTLRYFRKGEDGKIRFDSDEGLLRSYRGPNVKQITISAMGKTLLTDLGGKYIHDLKVWMPNQDDVFVYCITALRQPGPFPFDLRFTGFGNACVVVKKPEQFFGRLVEAAAPHARKIRCDLVEYVPAAAHAGEMGPFRKFDEFAWQSEYRMAVEPLVARPEHLDLTLGSIGDIAELLPIGALPHLEFSYT